MSYPWIHEIDGFYVIKTKDGYEVCKPCGTTHAITDSCYTEKSIAIARCNYLAKRAKASNA